MTKQELTEILKERFRSVVEQNDLDKSEIKISARGLSPEEAIGITKRQDYPILTGKEVMLQAEYQGSFGQAFTDAPSDFIGTLEEILGLDLEEDSHNRALFIAAMNAVMKKLGLVSHTVHCKSEEPEKCVTEFESYIRGKYGSPKIALVGYQPSMLEALSEEFRVRVLDLNPENVGKTRYGVKVEDGVKDYTDVVLEWADVVLCTGSTLCNGTMVNYIDIGKDVLFFGITAAGAAELLGLKSMCPLSK